jgi:hypothetical protein
MYYTGIDEHKDNCFLTTVDDAGVVHKSARIHNDLAPVFRTPRKDTILLCQEVSRCQSQGAIDAMMLSSSGTKRTVRT